MSLSFCSANPQSVEDYFKEWTKLIDAVVKAKNANSTSALSQLSRYIDNALLSKEVIVSDFNSSSLQYLLWQNSDDIEVSLNVQGVVAEACLLPVRVSKKRSGQVIHLSNKPPVNFPLSHPLDTHFKNAIEAINMIYHFMASYNDSIGPRKRHFVGDMEAIRAECRLFSVRKETAGGDGLTLSTQLDSTGLVAKENRAGTHLYTSDNVVDVYQRKVENGKAILAEISPALVRPGDVVDLAISFRVVHGKNFHIKLEGIEMAKLAASDTPYKGPSKRKAIA
ncbi:hypothetical protein BDZ89DRAFT_1147062 [Hymenopellis radicata]|nr:hypothetical protein BDZ89DRAFT_1147062 [Hymenopellis radicata]